MGAAIGLLLALVVACAGPTATATGVPAPTKPVVPTGTAIPAAVAPTPVAPTAVTKPTATSPAGPTPTLSPVPLAGTASPPRAAAGMVRLPAGSFTLGRDDGPADERPAHAVHLAAFELDVLAVTNAQFAAFLEAAAASQGLFDADDSDARIHRVDGRWRADLGAEEHPVYEASWFGAGEYCRWRGARLPSEAEWERAARGVEGRPYPWGNTPPDPTRARFAAGWRDSVPVGSLPNGATPDGLLGLAGNEWEWTSSLYRPYPYRADDGREDAASREERVTRGGGQDSPADHLRTTYRGRGLSRGPSAGHHNIGFRCARDAG